MIHAQIEKKWFSDQTTTRLHHRHDRAETEKQNKDMLLLSITSLGQHSEEIRD